MSRPWQTLVVVLICSALLTAAGCRENQDPGRQLLLSFKCAGVGESGHCAVYGPTITDLVTRPDAYQNLPVEVFGYLSISSQDTFLYPDLDAYEHFENRRAVYLNIPPNQRPRFAPLQGRYVRVEGTFKRLSVCDIVHADVAGRPDRQQTIPFPPPASSNDAPRK